jgi:hypothetical protein
MITRTLDAGIPARWVARDLTAIPGPGMIMSIIREWTHKRLQ